MVKGQNKFDTEYSMKKKWLGVYRMGEGLRKGSSHLRPCKINKSQFNIIY